jgi:hypothetical protein
MGNDNTRTEQSPSDPQYGWRGVDTDIRNRPSANRLDEMRRCVPAEPTVPGDTKITRNSLGGLMETAVQVRKNEVAALCYNAGISEVLARRIVALEHAMENPLLLQTVTELAEAHANLVTNLAGELAELRQAIAALQAKKK